MKKNFKALILLWVTVLAFSSLVSCTEAYPTTSSKVPSSSATSSWAEGEKEKFLTEPFMDDDGFGEVVKAAGFEVTRRGCTILWSGFNANGEEYRVISDSNDLNCEKLAIIEKSKGKEWVVKQVSNPRSEDTGMISLRNVPYPAYTVYGAYNSEGAFKACGYEQHRFFQGNNATNPISWEVLNQKLLPGVFCQVWQSGQYYIIHLMYYGTASKTNTLGLENIVPSTVYQMLEEMGCVQPK